MEQSAFGGILCLFRSDWSLRWLDVCVCPDALEKAFAFAVRDVASWLRRLVGCVHPCQVRALRSIAPEAGLESSSAAEDEVSLAQKESCADFSDVLL